MRIAISCLLLFLFGGCCKVFCDGTELMVSFQRFKAIDTDTVLFVKFLPGAITNPIDTVRLLSTVSPSDTTKSAVSHSISSAFEWKVLLPSLNKQYTAEDFELTNQKCKCG